MEEPFSKPVDPASGPTAVVNPMSPILVRLIAVRVMYEIPSIDNSLKW